ncbi:MAG TPA: SusE domain-containing protein [Flavihumibacter sp.]|jgi:hypothetical protein
MNRLLFNIASFFLMALVITGCSKDDRDINMNITAVTQFYAPVDNLFVELDPSSSATVGFEWEHAKAEDGALVMYEVAFDKEGGDFSAPVYKIASDGNGVQNRLNLSHKDLNRIANFAGIEALSTGKLIWTVLASKGTNVKKATLSRTIELKRPAGFAEIPNEVYLTGDATEAGTDLANAIKLKATNEPGVFEIYTSLSEGTYKFVNRTSGSITSYQVQGAALREGEAVASPATGTKIYRMLLDFNSAAFTITEITNLGFWFAPQDQIQAELQYVGGGRFEALNVPIEFRQESWGRDERYKFRMKLKSLDGTEFEEDWGSVNRDNSRPTAATPAAWYQLYKQEVNRWDYTFKFMTEADMKNVDIKVSFAPDAPYTHEIIIK